MSDDDRNLRRVSDATRARIDELAGGWTIDPPPHSLIGSAAHAGSAGVIDPPPLLIESTVPTSDVADPTSPTLVRAVGGEENADIALREASDATAYPPSSANTTSQERPRLVSPQAAQAVTGPRRTSEHGVRRESLTSTSSAPSLVQDGGMLPRTRGVAGDIRYLATVMFGVRRAKRERVAAEAKQSLRLASRLHHLTTLGRQAVVTDDYDHPAIRDAREALRPSEDKRAKHATAVSAANAELEKIRRDRDAASEAHAAAVTAMEAERAELAKQLIPLVRQAAAARRRAADLSDQVRSIKTQIAKAEQRLSSAKSQVDPVAVQAEIAALKADQQAIEQDQPTIATELAAVGPLIDSLRAAIRSIDQRYSDLAAEDAQDQIRTTELREAAGACRKIDERGMADAEVARDKILSELGQRLYDEHPSNLSAQLGPIDQIDQEIEAAERRIAELHDLATSVDRMKVVRGSIALALVAAAGGAGVWFLAG